MRKLNVSTTMSRPNKLAPQVKRVAPPAIPTIPDKNGAETEENLCEPVKHCVADDDCSGFTEITQSLQNRLIQTPGILIEPHQTPQPLTHKTAVYLHQQLALQEDQGIDLATQSPGRESPGSSSSSAGSVSRYSTVSLDSGRASSYVTGSSSTATRPVHPGHNFIQIQGQSGTSMTQLLSSPRSSSISSNSIGSSLNFDRLSQRSSASCCASDYGSSAPTDLILILDWLNEINFNQYSELFLKAGYDLATIQRMTPEDLTAIGIKNPIDREYLKQQIDNLKLPDNLPNFVPGSIQEWLRLLRLDEYIQPILDQNYRTVREVTQLTWEDLEDIGIVKLGHQKKILLAIKRVNDILSGKWNLKLCAQNQCGGISNCCNNCQLQSQQQNNHHNNIYINSDLPHNCHNYNNKHKQKCLDFNSMNQESKNDIVVIKIRQPRGKSLESLEECNDVLQNSRTHMTFSHYSTDYCYYPKHTKYYPATNLQIASTATETELPVQCLQYENLQCQRSYDDGDVTPTNDIGTCGGTLPRQRNPTGNGGNLLSRCRLVDRNCCPSNLSNNLYNDVNCHGGGENIQDLQQQQRSIPLMSNSVRYSATIPASSPLFNKKSSQQDPPDPPRRQSDSATLLSSTTISNTTLINNDNLNLNSNKIIEQKHRHKIYTNDEISPHFQQQTQLHQQLDRDSPIYANYTHRINQQPNQQITTAEIHYCDRNQSKDTIYQSNSTIQQNPQQQQSASIDSIDTIPFANENTGTIKQRFQQHRTDPKPHVKSTDQSAANAASVNVLNDIGNMLANLTDELDAMLEEEKRVGISDSE